MRGDSDVILPLLLVAIMLLAVVSGNPFIAGVVSALFIIFIMGDKN